MCSEATEKVPRKKEEVKETQEVKEKHAKKEEIKDEETAEKKERKYYKDEHFYSGGIDNLDRDLSSVSNSSASSGPPQDGPDRGIFLLINLLQNLWN